jgi:hypothetical protein
LPAAASNGLAQPTEARHDRDGTNKKKNFEESTGHGTGSAEEKIKIPSAGATTWANPRKKFWMDGRAHGQGPRKKIPEGWSAQGGGN